MKKRTMSILIALAMVMTTLFAPATGFAASTEAAWQVPTAPMTVDNDVVKVAGHAANSSSVHFLGGNLVTARSSDFKNYVGDDKSAEQNLEGIKTMSEIGVFGTDINQNPDPYWWNLFYNYYAAANGKSQSEDAVKIAPLGSPMMANTVLIPGAYNDLTKEGTDLPHSLGQKADVLLGIGAESSGSGDGYAELLNTMKDYPDTYDPQLVAYKSNNLQDHVDTMYALAKAMKDTGKKTRYGDPMEIAKKYEEYVKGLQLYMVSQMEKGAISKKTVAVIAPETRSDGTYEAFNSTMARGTAASCRAAEYIEAVTDNIIDTENIQNSGTETSKLYFATAKQIAKADAIYITVQSTSGTNGDNSPVMNGDEFAAKIAEQAGVSTDKLPPIYSVDPNGVFGSIRANSNENALGVGVYEGFLYPEALNPTYAAAFFAENFYHVNDNAVKSVTETVMAKASLPEGYEADATGYKAGDIQAKINAGLSFYVSNRDRFEGTKLELSDNIDLSQYKPEKPEPVSIGNATVSSLAAKVYTGKSLKPAVTVKYNGKKLTANKDYTVAYKNNVKPGKATVTIKGTGNYKGTKTVYFYINPKKASVSSVTSPKKGQLKVTWKKDANATGYTVMIAKNSKFTGAKKYTVKGSKTTSKTIKNLTKGKKYYAKVRAYKTVSGKTLYGTYSTVKTRTVKSK